jgi:hypothetical protein
MGDAHTRRFHELRDRVVIAAAADAGTVPPWTVPGARVQSRFSDGKPGQSPDAERKKVTADLRGLGLDRA